MAIQYIDLTNRKNLVTYLLRAAGVVYDKHMVTLTSMHGRRVLFEEKDERSLAERLRHIARAVMHAVDFTKYHDLPSAGMAMFNGTSQVIDNFQLGKMFTQHAEGMARESVLLNLGLRDASQKQFGEFGRITMTADTTKLKDNRADFTINVTCRTLSTVMNDNGRNWRSKITSNRFRKPCFDAMNEIGYTARKEAETGCSRGQVQISQEAIDALFAAKHPFVTMNSIDNVDFLMIKFCVNPNIFTLGDEQDAITAKELTATNNFFLPKGKTTAACADGSAYARWINLLLIHTMHEEQRDRAHTTEVLFPEGTIMNLETSAEDTVGGVDDVVVVKELKYVSTSYNNDKGAASDFINMFIRAGEAPFQRQVLVQSMDALQRTKYSPLYGVMELRAVFGWEKGVGWNIDQCLMDSERCKAILNIIKQVAEKFKCAEVDTLNYDETGVSDGDKRTNAIFYIRGIPRLARLTNILIEVRDRVREWALTDDVVQYVWDEGSITPVQLQAFENAIKSEQDYNPDFAGSQEYYWVLNAMRKTFALHDIPKMAGSEGDFWRKIEACKTVAEAQLMLKAATA